MPDFDQALTPEQASRALGVTITTLRAWVKRGKLRCFLTPGGHRRFLWSDIQLLQGKPHGEGGTTDPA